MVRDNRAAELCNRPFRLWIQHDKSSYATYPYKVHNNLTSKTLRQTVAGIYTFDYLSIADTRFRGYDTLCLGFCVISVI